MNAQQEISKRNMTCRNPILPGIRELTKGKSITDMHETAFLELITRIYTLIGDNYLKRESDSKSKENFRFKLMPDKGVNSKMKEKYLEKEIARVKKDEGADHWANQVPTASGLLRPTSDKNRNIDFVHDLDNDEYEFIELKIDANEPGYAALEIIINGLIYVFYRANDLGNGRLSAKTPNDYRLLFAKAVHLKVVAPKTYYSKEAYSQLRDFQSMASCAIAKLSAEKIPGVVFDFSFESFMYRDGDDSGNVIRFHERRPLQR